MRGRHVSKGRYKNMRKNASSGRQNRRGQGRRGRL